MTRLLLAGLLLFTTTATAAQRPPQEILTDIEALIVELRAALPVVEPPPPVVVETPVATAGELTDALAAATPVIRLAPGTYVGNFTLPSGVTLLGVDTPPARVSPADVAAVTLVPSNIYNPTLTITGSDVRVSGLTVMLGASDRTAVNVGDIMATDAAVQPTNVVLDRIAVLAGSAGGVRGIALHTRSVAVTRSYIAGFVYSGRDSQAIWISNGPGPYLIEDNYLEASGENLMAGGDRIRIVDCVPSDITVRGNLFYKPEEWRTRYGSVKNLIEFKAGRRVLVEGNVFDGNWKDAQAGDSIVLTPRNPGGYSPWIVVEDVVIRNNIVRRARDGYVVSILGNDDNQITQQTARVTIEGNLFEDARSGVKVLRGVADSLVLRRNTWPAITGTWLLLNAKYGVITPLTSTGNVTRSGAYGVLGDGSTGVGLPSLTANTVLVDFTGSVIEGNSGTRTLQWPEGNTLLPSGALASILDPVTFKHPDGNVGY